MVGSETTSDPEHEDFSASAPSQYSGPVADTIQVSRACCSSLHSQVTGGGATVQKETTLQPLLSQDWWGPKGRPLTDQ